MMKSSFVPFCYSQLLAVVGIAVMLPSCMSTQSPGPMGNGVAGTGAPQGGLRVVNRNADASQLQFSDGSRWAVQPAGQAVTLTWQPNDPMEIIRVSHPSYPAVLSNLRTGQGTRARPASGGY